MTREHKAYAMLLLVVLAAGLFLMSQSSPREVKISVTYSTNNQLVLNIRNTTTNTILIDGSPRGTYFSKFDWELFSGKNLLARSSKSKLLDDPRIIYHPPGPIDIYSGRFIQMELNSDYSEFEDRNLLKTADTLLWYYRVWDMDAKKWIQAHGTVQLKHP